MKSGEKMGPISWNRHPGKVHRRFGKL